MKQYVIALALIGLLFPPAFAGQYFGGGSVINNVTAYPVDTAPMGQIGQAVTVPLTAAGNTPIYTVPTGKTLFVYDTVVTGVTAQAGTLKTSVLKIGTAANSYSELLGAGGYSFITATSTSLLSVGATISGLGLVSLLPSSSQPKVFNAGSVITANVSGVAPLTSGSVSVSLVGILQ